MEIMQFNGSIGLGAGSGEERRWEAEQGVISDNVIIGTMKKRHRGFNEGQIKRGIENRKKCLIMIIKIPVEKELEMKKLSK